MWSPANDARFATPFVGLGLVPEAASSLIAPRLMGQARAFSLLVMGRPLDADDAKAAGLVNTVVAPDAVEAEAMKAAREIAALPPQRRRCVAPADARRAGRDSSRASTRKPTSSTTRLQSAEARAAFAAFMTRKALIGRTRAMSLKGKTLFITGGSRGIGLAIALKAARDGANVAIAAKTVEPHPKLAGTIHTAAAEIEKAGGRALALAVDVRDEAAVKDALDQTAAQFGGIDIVVNNASAIQLTPAARPTCAAST